MKPNPKVEVLPITARMGEAAIEDAFNPERVGRDLARFVRVPGMLEKYVERLRIRFQKSNERAVLEQWIGFYQAGERLVASRAALERRKSEFLHLASEHELRESELSASVAKQQADAEEHLLRRDQATRKRQNLERSVDGGQPTIGGGEDERKLNEAFERRKLDGRWDLYESLSALNTLLDLQLWRRQQRDHILSERQMSPADQSEALQFVDDLFQQRRAELKANTSIFEVE